MHNTGMPDMLPQKRGTVQTAAVCSAECNRAMAAPNVLPIVMSSSPDLSCPADLVIIATDFGCALPDLEAALTANTRTQHARLFNEQKDESIHCMADAGWQHIHLVSLQQHRYHTKSVPDVEQMIDGLAPELLASLDAVKADANACSVACAC